MSNISKTSASIKQKLSLNDYRKPEKKQQVGTQEKNLKNPPTKHATIKPAKKTSAAKQLATRDDHAPKIKATYYLGKSENSMLMDIYIDQLKKYRSADKSALICQAIRLLYKQEK